MKVLITGADGFIGKNLCLFLSAKGIKIVRFTREHTLNAFEEMLEGIDCVVHLAGINRPQTPLEFQEGNVELTQALCNALIKQGKSVPIIYSSSIQAKLNNPYGVSKRNAEQIIINYARQKKARAFIYRLPNVFGKWARPNYNSVVATFCHNISQGKTIEIHDPCAVLRLVYIDDVMESFLSVLQHRLQPGFIEVNPVYSITVGDLARQIQAFKDSRQNLISENVGSGLIRALYATYVSYLRPEQFSYVVPQYGDERGIFVEILKTKESGQFSFFTAHPGVTRGGHYHHSKTEKFLVIKGKAKFRFSHMITGEYYELFTCGERPEIVETVTGWTHDITNVGNDEMLVLLWANEIFDREKPDTYAQPIVSN